MSIGEMNLDECQVQLNLEQFYWLSNSRGDFILLEAYIFPVYHVHVGR